jgi:hypothetical protein
MRSRAFGWLASSLLKLPGGAAEAGCRVGEHGLASANVFATTWSALRDCPNSLDRAHVWQPLQLLWHSTAAVGAKTSSGGLHHEGREQNTSADKGFVRGGFTVDMVSSRDADSEGLCCHV